MTATTDNRELRVLVQKWRDESNRRAESAHEMENDNPDDAAWNHGIGAGMDDCADELEALLTRTEADDPVRVDATEGVKGRDRLWDSQWVNIVNHANCYRDHSKEDAVATAVKLTEAAMRKNMSRTEAGVVCRYCGDTGKVVNGTGAVVGVCAEHGDAAPVADGAVDLYGPLTGAQEARMRGPCMTHLRTVEVAYPDTGKFIRDWLTHVELRAHPQDASAGDAVKLGAFAASILNLDEDWIGDVDGGTLQDNAEKFGLLQAVEVTEACSENCNCAGYGDFPQTCYRPTDTMKRAIAALHQPAKGGAL